MARQPAAEIIQPARPERSVSIYEDGSMTISDAATVLGMTPQGIRVWLDQGAPLHFKGGQGRGNASRVRVPDLVKWRQDFVTEDLREKRSSGKYDEKAEKARERFHVANIRAREDLQQQGELVSIASVAAVVDAQYAEIRANLQNIPSRLSTALAPISDPREIRDLLRQEIHDVMLALSGGDEVAQDAAVKKTTVLDLGAEEDDADA